MYFGSGAGSSILGWLSSRMFFIAPNHVRAGDLPPKMFPPPPQTRTLPGPASQIPPWPPPNLNVIAAPASWGVPPTKAADTLPCVVPVLPISGRSQPTPLAAAYEVPPGWSSLLMPTARVFASGSGTACSHGASLICTGAPLRSVTAAIGVGGHQTPPERIVAATLPISRPLTGLNPSVNAPNPGPFA